MVKIGDFRFLCPGWLPSEIYSVCKSKVQPSRSLPAPWAQAMPSHSPLNLVRKAGSSVLGSQRSPVLWEGQKQMCITQLILAFCKSIIPFFLLSQSVNPSLEEIQHQETLNWALALPETWIWMSFSDITAGLVAVFCAENQSLIWTSAETRRLGAVVILVWL